MLSTSLGLLEFDEQGRLVSVTEPAPLRLPLDDGKPGPVIDMPRGASIDEGGQGTDWFVSLEISSPPVLNLSNAAQQALAR